MDSAVLGLAASMVAGAIWWWWRQQSTRPAPRPELPPPPEPDLDPGDAADLDRRFAALVEADARARNDVVAFRLDLVRRRAVPVRVVEPVRSLGASRVRFADGTTVIGHGVIAGDMGVLVAAVRHHAVHVASCQRQADGMHVVFRWPGASSGLAVVVTGLDQPD